MQKPVAQTAPLGRIRRALVPVLAGAALFSALINLLMLTGSVYMLQVYDRVLPSGSVPTLLGLFAVVVVLYALLGVYDLLRQRLLSRGGHRLEREMAGPVFSVFLARGTSGPLRDMETLRGFMGSPAVPGLMDLPWVPMYLIVLWILHPLLALLTLGGVVLGLIFALAGQAISRRSMKTAAAPEAEAQIFVARAAESRELITALGLGGRITAHWRAIQNNAQTEVQRGSEAAEILSSLSRATRMLLQSGLLTLGAWLAIRQDISAGSIVAASILSGRAMAPADQVLGQWRAISRARTAWARLRGTLADPAAAETRRHTDLPAPSGQISALRLTRLAPAPEGTPAAQRARLLDQVSFELEPGDGLAVVGASASGKSTLARVLTGVWPCDAGELRLDGATRDQWDPEALGRHFGYLPQVVTLMSGSVRDNIARFDAGVADATVIEAARLAGVHEMILALPQGYDTKVGAEGLPLSGGQIQRLGLARAFLGRPRILVLDEPNANLDTAGEEVLTRALTLLRAAGSTVIVMAHRPSVLAVANKVLVLHQGKVAKFGPKEEVMPPVLVPAPPVAPPRLAAPAADPAPGPGRGAGRAAGRVGAAAALAGEGKPVTAAPSTPDPAGVPAGAGAGATAAVARAGRALSRPLPRVAIPQPAGVSQPAGVPGGADPVLTPPDRKLSDRKRADLDTPDPEIGSDQPLNAALAPSGALSLLLRTRAGHQMADDMPPSSPARLEDIPAPDMSVGDMSSGDVLPAPQRGAPR